MADGILGYPLRHLFWSPPVFREWCGSMGLMDWVESPSAHVFKINVPGYQKEDIKVEIEEGNILHIKGKGVKDEEKEKEKENAKEWQWHVAERGRGKGEFSRHIELPDNVKVEHIKAHLQNGLLTVVVPKHASPNPTSKLRNINITSRL